MRLPERPPPSYSSCTDLSPSKAQAATGEPGRAATCHTQVCSTAVQQASRVACAALTNAGCNVPATDFGLRCAVLPVVPAGWQSPAPSPPRSPLAGRSAGSFKQLQGLQSPIAKRFMRAATGDDVIVVPGDKSALQLDGEAEEEDADEAAEPADSEGAAEATGAQVDAVSGAEVLVIQDEASDAGLAAAGSAVQEEQSVLDAGMAAEPSGSSTASSTGHEDAAGVKQPSKHMQPRKLWGAHGSAPGSRPGSSKGSRPGSASTTVAASSRRTTGSSVLEVGGPPRRQSSHSAVAEPVPSYAAGTRSSSARGAAGIKAAAGTGRQLGCPPPGASRVKATPSRPQTAGKAQLLLRLQNLLYHAAAQCCVGCWFGHIACGPNLNSAPQHTLIWHSPHRFVCCCLYLRCLAGAYAAGVGGSAAPAG